MQINSTFIFQIVNFGITYFFFSKYLLNPIAQLIQKREWVEKNLVDDIKNRKLQLDQFIKKKNNDLLFFQKNMAEHNPLLKIEIPEVFFEIQYQKNDTVIQKLISTGKTILVKKVSHAYRQ
jgi:hypothetical protein